MAEEIYNIEFIGGIADGRLQAWPGLPPELRLPIMPRLDFSIAFDEFQADMPVKLARAVYRRLADTANYIYIKTE